MRRTIQAFHQADQSGRTAEIARGGMAGSYSWWMTRPRIYCCYFERRGQVYKRM